MPLRGRVLLIIFQRLLILIGIQFLAKIRSSIKITNFIHMSVLKIIIMVLGASVISQKPIQIIEKQNVEIVSGKTGKSVRRSDGFKSPNSLVSKFGVPDSTQIKDIAALGGKTTTLFYDCNYFNVPADCHAHGGFEICNNDFFIRINKNLTIKVGDTIEKIEKLVHPARHFKNINIKRFGSRNIGKFSLPYGFKRKGELLEKEQWLIIYYDQDSKKILSILEFTLS